MTRMLLISVVTTLGLVAATAGFGQVPTATPSSGVTAPEQAPQRAPYPGTTPDYEADRDQVWNSPEMVQARQWLIDRGRRSTRTSAQQVNQYLATLRQLSPTQMRDWLKRFQTARAHEARAAAVEKAARQMMVDHALSRLESTRQGYAAIDLGQNQAAEMARRRLHEQQLLAQQLGDAIRTDRAYTVALSQEPRYNPMAPTLDPASPNRFVRSFAAATLPGDLPPSDSRNFIRGEEGIDTGEGEPAAAGVGGGAAP